MNTLRQALHEYLDMRRSLGFRPKRVARRLFDFVAFIEQQHDAGLKVRAFLDEAKYPKGVKVSDAQLASVNLTPHTFHGNWNYTISPDRQKLHRRK